MNFKERLKHGLEHSRGFTAKVFAEIGDDENWVRRPTGGANHALWIAGHLGVATNYFIGLIDPTKAQNRKEYGLLFGKGSQPKDSLSEYPSPEEIKGFWSERATAFIDLLDACTDDDLEREIPKGPGFMPDVASVFQMAVWHEALHSGQLSVIHRLVGQTPIADR